MDPLGSVIEGQSGDYSTDLPDVMNDPAFDPSTRGTEKASEDVDTCRICRGESSKEEELFYPCKCSGSIKFVHQNCLMEWLSHSKKKHCELCKTPFRFTKLYHAHMPKSVPIPIFFRQAAVHVWKNFLTWSRLHFVAFVWVFWLPWCMRCIWRGLFWIGDGGWVEWKKRIIRDAASGLTSRKAASATLSPSPTLPSSRQALASAFITELSGKLSSQWTPLIKTLSKIQDKSLSFRLVKKLYSFSFKKTAVEPLSTTPTSMAAIPSQTARAPSWLSEMPLLKSLTRSPVVNNVIIDIIEGQIITISVVITFILIFLIREWVMQQQQNLLLGPEANQNAVVPPNEPAENQEQANPEINDTEHAPQAPAAAGQDNAIPIPRPAARILARPRRRLQRRATHPEGQNPVQDAEEVVESSDLNGINIAQAERDGLDKLSASNLEPSQRPVVLDRGVIARAVEIRRAIEESSRLSPDQQESRARIFQELWARAGQNPSEVRRIVEEERSSQELDWIVAFMRKLEGAPPVLTKVAAQEMRSQSMSSTQKADIIEYRRSLSTPTKGRLRAKSLNSPLPLEESHHLPHALQFKQQQEHVKRAHLATDPPILEPFHQESLHNLQGQSSSSSGMNEETPTLQSLPEETTTESSIPSNSTILTSEMPSEDDTASPQELAELVLEQSQHQQAWIERLIELMWGGVNIPGEQPDAPAADEEHVVEDLANEAPFFPVARRQPLLAPPPVDRHVPAQDPEVVAAAAQAGVDPNGAEGIDDAEDLEGIMELIGMQGAIIGLIQNGMFCAFLVSLTIAVALWVPYMFGKVLLVIVDRPVSLFEEPLRLASTIADMIVDFSIFAGGCSFYWVDSFFNVLFAPIGWLVPAFEKLTQNKILAETAKSYAERALKRLAIASMSNSEFIGRALDIPTFSALAHESLYHLEDKALSVLEWICHTSSKFYRIGVEAQAIVGLCTSITSKTQAIFWKLLERSSKLFSFAPLVLQINLFKISLTRSHRPFPVDYSLAIWSSKDRSVAIICGYLFFAVLGVLYLRLAAAIRGTNKNGRVESGLADILYQAGGVMKVVLIISIEMIVFPLYCGLLLDLALLPLFGNASLLSRIQFIKAYPNTSLFIHWFIGTCYMFHFALFVSMCRKIMRSGVLCK